MIASTESALRSTADVFCQAWACYRRHLVPVVGLSLIASAQRVVLQLAGDDLPGSLVALSEVPVLGVRIWLLVLAYGWMITADRDLRDVGLGDALRRVGRALRRHWRSALLTVATFAALVVVLDVIPDLVIAPRVPEDVRHLYFAVLLAVKNPTVIAYTLLWDIALVHQLLRLGAPDRSPTATVPSPATAGDG